MPTEAPSDKVSHASLNGIYVKAQEMDRGHNVKSAPSFSPPGDVRALGSAFDAQAHASDSSALNLSAVADAGTCAAGADVQTRASGADVQTHASEW